MAIATMTSKGQITIPKRIRERLGLRAGDRVDFAVDEDGTVIIVPENRRLDDVYGLLSHRARKAVSVEEMDRRVERAMREQRR